MKFAKLQVKKRTKALTDLFNSYLPYENRIGQIYDVLVTEISHDQQYYVAHNKYYEQVLVPQVSDLMGKWAKVKIISYCKHSMTGEIISYEKGTVVGPNASVVDTTQHSYNLKKSFLIFFICTVIFVRLLMLFY